MKAQAVLRRWFCLATIGFAAATFLPPRAHAQRPLGIDVSSYQGSADSLGATNIDWPTEVNTAPSGLPFTVIKAAEATRSDGYYPDADFVYNITHAKAAGVISGAYYFAHPELESADTAAAYFWSIAGSYIKADGLSLMPMLDFEQNVTNANPAFTSATLSAWANTWCQDIVNYGKTNGVKLNPIIYTFTSYATGKAGYGPALDGTVTQWPLWMASYPTSPNTQTGAPSSTAPWSTWNFWQYTDNYTASGVEGGVDGDVFNGTLAALKASFLVVPTGPTITVAPSNTVVFASTNYSFSVTATSTGGPISYQWAKNGTNISGATASNYVVTNVQIANAGSYYSVTLTNTNGFTTSSNAYLFVKSAPTNAPGSITTSNLVNWWTADGNLTDIIGGNIARPQGALTFTNGEVGSAMHFDGATTVLTTGLADLPLPWTVSVWVNYTISSQTSAGILENGTNSLKLEQYKNTHQVGLSVYGVGDYVFGTGYSVPQNTWTYLSFVGTNTGISLYANGVLKGTLTNNFALPRAYIGGAYYVGSGQYLDFMKGNLDELMIFNKALNQTQITALYSAGASGVVKAPQILSGQSLANNQFSVAVRGLIGKNYLIYSSPDLTNWTLLGSLLNTQGTNQFTVSGIQNNQQLFYRIGQTY